MLLLLFKKMQHYNYKSIKEYKKLNKLEYL